MAMIYDSFTVTAGITAEMLGLAPRGEGFMLWKSGKAAPGGSFPMNTNGGGLSYTHPGMYGMFLLIEAVQQLRGEAGARQVADAQVALCHGNGGVLSSQVTALLGTAATV